MPGLSEQGLDAMMDWRRRNPEATEWPKAVVEDEVVGGKPTGKVNVARILE